MTYLLDTCVLSELTKPVPNGGVLGFLRGTDEASLRLSVLTLGELEKGVARLPASAKKEALEDWLREIREAYGARILEVTAEVAVEWGRLGARTEMKGRPVSVVDALIASTALVHGLTVVTRNTKDLARTSVKTENPWR
jgi:predicted nucleic acid-binding protein